MKSSVGGTSEHVSSSTDWVLADGAGLGEAGGGLGDAGGAAASGVEAEAAALALATPAGPARTLIARGPGREQPGAFPNKLIFQDVVLLPELMAVALALALADPNATEVAEAVAVA